MDQVRHFHLDPDKGRKLHAQRALFGDVAELDRAVKEAVDLRRRLAAIPVNEVGDAEEKARLAAQADARLEALGIVADVIVGAGLAPAVPGGRRLDERLVAHAPDVGKAVDGDESAARRLATVSRQWLDAGRPAGAPERHPLHWPLAFPEVFVDRPRAGFDALVGNPPFLGGQRITGAMGTDFRSFLVEQVAGGAKGSADLVAYFFLRGAQVAGNLGLLATNTISQGDTREVGLDRLTGAGWTITRAVKSVPWPGYASLEIAKVWLTSAHWAAPFVLGGETVAGITPSLDQLGRAAGNPHRLSANAGRS